MKFLETLRKVISSQAFAGGLKTRLYERQNYRYEMDRRGSLGLRKRIDCISALSSVVERRSPKPDAVGSSPTGRARESIILRILLNQARRDIGPKVRLFEPGGR